MGFLKHLIHGKGQRQYWKPILNDKVRIPFSDPMNCPKCGHADPHIKWQDETRTAYHDDSVCCEEAVFSSYKYQSIPDPHFNCQCPRCRYKWETEQKK